MLLWLSRAGFCVASVELLAATDWLLKGVVDERRKVLVPLERALEVVVTCQRLCCLVVVVMVYMMGWMGMGDDGVGGGVVGRKGDVSPVVCIQSGCLSLVISAT